jgi:ferrochelatase
VTQVDPPLPAGLRPGDTPIEDVPVDSVLVVGFGGPAGPEEVMPFLRRVTEGRGVHDDRLAEVAAHYARFGGVSPIVEQHRALAEAVGRALPLPVYAANRHSAPELPHVLGRMAADGRRRSVVLLMSAYSSWSGCRAYKEALTAASARTPGAPMLEVARKYHGERGFIDPFADGTRAALDSLPGAGLLFTAHSVPRWQAESSRYVGQLRHTADRVAAAVGRAGDWELVWQSRSGPPSSPWLEPDVVDRVRQRAPQASSGFVVVPIGFVSDHMEVLWDLDVELAGVCAELGLPMRRVATPGVDPRFVAMLAGLVRERLDAPQVGGDGCPDGAGCCPGPDVGPLSRGVRPVG